MHAFRRSDQPFLSVVLVSAAGWLLACASAESPGSAPTSVNPASGHDAAARRNEDAATVVLDAGALVKPPESTYAPQTIDGGEPCTLPPINPGPGVPLRRVSSNPPSPMGGSLASGTYRLASVNIFTGAGGATGDTGDWLARRCTFTSTSYGCLESEGDASVDGGPTASTPFGGGHTASGSMIAFSRSCPPAATWIRDYTATATELHLFTKIPGSTVRETMVKE